MSSDANDAVLGLLGLNAASPMDTSPTVPLKRKQSSAVSFHDEPPSDSINCICGFTYDDGFSIGCDSCSRWCHAACFGVADNDVPDNWYCWVCRPRAVDRERAVKVQKSRQRAANAFAQQQQLQQKSRVSPGVERKPRRASAAAIEGGGNTKRKRRASISHQQPNEDEPVDIDEPWTHSYVAIEDDVVADVGTRDKLRQVATDWRGITALSPPITPNTTPVLLPPEKDPSISQISLHHLSPSTMHPGLSSNINPSVRPPSYAVHATRPIASSDLVAPYTSTIVPSAAYLSDPLNAYLYLGMPKPFVHLLGPPLDVALDARITGGQSRFVRSGCRPNTVLRPVLCSRARNNSKSHPGEEDGLTFGIFALRDLKAHEEVVLGWEWDDGSIVHRLPALLESPHTFPPHELQQLRHQMTLLLHALSSTFTTCACGAHARDCALTRMAEFVEGQTPPTPAPSPPSNGASAREGRTKDKERTRNKEARSTGKVDLGPLVGVARGFHTRERDPMSGGMSGVEMVTPAGPSTTPSFEVDASSITVTRGKRQKNRASRKTAVVSDDRDAHTPTLSRDRKGKGRADALPEPLRDVPGPADKEMTPRATRTGRVLDDPDASSSVPDRSRSRSPVEDRLPPKMRKRFIHRSMEALREGLAGAQTPVRRAVSNSEQGSERMYLDGPVFDPRRMPPPPLPASRSPQLPQPSSSPPASTPSPASSVSPTAQFSNLSLLSPIVGNSSPYFPSRRSPSPTAPRTPAAGNGMVHVRSLTPELSNNPWARGLKDDDPPSQMLAGLDQPLNLSAAYPRIDHWWDPQDPLRPSFDAFTKDLHRSSAAPLATSQSMPEAAGIFHPAEHAPTEPANPQTLSPPVQEPPRAATPPAPKVKMSLKDFALRKKKQRELSEHKSEPPSPANADTSLPADRDADLVDAPSQDRDLIQDNNTNDGSVMSRDGMSLDTRPAIPPPRDWPLGAKPARPPSPLAQNARPEGHPEPDAPMLEASDTEDSYRGKVELVEASLSLDESRAALGPPADSQSLPPGAEMLQEEGEILSPPPAESPPLPPRMYPPPTQPRGYSYAPPPAPSPPPARRSSAPFPSRPQQRMARLPSAPRALRGDAYPPYPSAYGRGGAMPRGPSADREWEREWRERERGWVGPPRGRG